MLKTLRVIIVLFTIIFLVFPALAQKTGPTDVLQTIPPIIVSSRTAQAGCTILNLSPGSAVSGGSGFIQASCPNFVPAIILSGTETPNFILATGFTQIALFYASLSCSFNYLPHRPGFPPDRLLGMNLTSSTPITFTTASNSTTQLLEGGYNYCLYYQNPPINGILTFTISWSP